MVMLSDLVLNSALFGLVLGTVMAPDRCDLRGNFFSQMAPWKPRQKWNDNRSALSQSFLAVKGFVSAKICI